MRLMVVALALAGCVAGGGGGGGSDGGAVVTGGTGGTGGQAMGGSGGAPMGGTGGAGGAPVGGTGGSVSGPACAQQTIAAVPAEITGTTDGASDDVGPASCEADATSGSADLVVGFIAPAAGGYTFSTAGSAFDTVLHVRAGDCAGETLGCNDDTGGTESSVVVELEAGQTVVAVVDGFGRATGAVRLRVEGREAVCDDAVDNDGDGEIDCADLDCFLSCEDPADWLAAWAQLEDEMLVATNAARARGADCGGDIFGPAGPMTMNELVRYAARLHSREMATQNYFSHDSLDGRTFAARMEAAGYGGATPWGENLQAGARTAEDAVAALMDSPGHCRNIMNPAFTVAGMGYAFDETSTYGAYWTQDFGAGD